MKHLIQVIEDEDRVVGLLDESFGQDPGAVGRTYIRIGSENEQRGMDAYSIVVSPYRLGETVGTLGVIGPTRMDYRRAVALVGSMASVLTHSDLDDARPPGSTAVA